MWTMFYQICPRKFVDMYSSWPKCMGKEDKKGWKFALLQAFGPRISTH
jgi:hypothetical protein